MGNHQDKVGVSHVRGLKVCVALQGHPNGLNQQLTRLAARRRRVRITYGGLNVVIYVLRMYIMVIVNVIIIII